MGKRLASYGNDVTLFTSAYDGCERETYQSGVRVIREGGKYRVYSKARRFVRQHCSEFDVFIDEINTVPFNINRVVKKKPVVALIHQLAREIWFYETRFPLNIIGYFALEPLWLRRYRRIPTLTVSDSTRQDLLRVGFRNVWVVHNGIGIEPLKVVPKKEERPILLFIGRLVRSKLPDHAIAAFMQVKRSFPDAQLWVLGDGYMRRRLQREAPDGVRFFGHVEDEDKFELLRKAHLLLAPSVREGWGISVVEANAMGTPAVGYHIPGLRDSIVDGVTGVLVQPLNPEALANAAGRILSDPLTLKRLSTNSLEWSRRFNWDKTAGETDAFLQSRLEQNDIFPLT